MLLNSETLDGIRDGRISLAFRRWRRPTVKEGGTLLTAIGQLAIDGVERVDPDAITEAEATAAGFAHRAALLAFLDERTDGDVYRVRLHLAGPDPRIALREAVPDAAETARLLARLERYDARSATGPWTRRTLELIRAMPATRAGDLAAEAGTERDAFKVDVRKLKGMGLTESLGTGYRLSPRGQAVLEALER